MSSFVSGSDLVSDVIPTIVPRWYIPNYNSLPLMFQKKM
jgi:hypothetical protein